LETVGLRDRGHRCGFHLVVNTSYKHMEVGKGFTTLPLEFALTRLHIEVSGVLSDPLYPSTGDSCVF
jgi:hypothetical protein